MKGLLLFVAGLLCGGGVSRPRNSQATAESPARVTGLEPGADDLPLATPTGLFGPGLMCALPWSGSASQNRSGL